MKNILKLLPIMLLVLTFSCDDDDSSSRFSNDPTSGWVEFGTLTAGTTITIITEELLIPVDIRVPVYQDGITISYELQAVEGDFSSIVTTGSSIVAEPEVIDPFINPRIEQISLVFNGVADLTETIVFDVVLTATDVYGVEIGLDENSITSYRISTPCPLDVDAIQGIYSVDEVFTSGTNEGLSLAAAFGESYQVEAVLDPNDPTQIKFILTNSIGFNEYFGAGTVATLDTCNGTVSFTSPLSLGGGFADMAVTSTSYTESPAVITADGELGNFGPYQFILTKQ
ncbi:hypothetical protein [Psychroserpens luteus]|uniref:Calx-beta domain-containing protein n=1 Tax=Psychroserpens luteus TaxID=1434066 RepID=A0ABW5ZST7_9FLAO|nr:hypothetical protein [Psychroserpens luteus]